MLKVRKLSDSPYAMLTTKPDDTGYDLYLLEDVRLVPRTPQKIKHGIAIELPQGFAAKICPRSSSFFREGDATMHQLLSGKALVDETFPTPLAIQDGTIDPGYGGELMTAVINQGPVPIVLKAGERISQLTIHKVEKPEITYVDAIRPTERGDNAFGSSGK